MPPDAAKCPLGAKSPLAKKPKLARKSGHWEGVTHLRVENVGSGQTTSGSAPHPPPVGSGPGLSMRQGEGHHLTQRGEGHTNTLGIKPGTLLTGVVVLSH